MSNMILLLGLDPFQKLGVGGGWVGDDCQKAFLSSTLVQALDLGLQPWTKVKNNQPSHSTETNLQKQSLIATQANLPDQNLWTYLTQLIAPKLIHKISSTKLNLL